MSNPLPDEEIALIRRNYKRCGEETVNAILMYRETGDAGLVETITRGIILRYLRPEGVEVFKNATLETPLIMLGIESLTMLEIILDIQDSLAVEINDSEFGGFRSLGDVIRFLQGRVESRTE
jgi:acyl carrier protein